MDVQIINKGSFITFEGGEGVGKTTQIKLLAEYLRGQGHEVVVTREPGGTPAGEIIRGLFLSDNNLEPMSEALLNFASRLEHVEKLIKPALAAGKWVLCDRFFDSTYVYQGCAEGGDVEKMWQLKKLVLGDFVPAKTILLDIDPEVSLKRAEARGEINRFEKKGLEFHKKIRSGFLELANAEPERIVVIDAAQNIEHVQAEIRSIFEV